MILQFVTLMLMTIRFEIALFIAVSIFPQDTQENQEREGIQGKGARLALGGHGETWVPWVQSQT